MDATKPKKLIQEDTAQNAGTNTNKKYKKQNKKQDYQYEY